MLSNIFIRFSNLPLVIVCTLHTSNVVGTALLAQTSRKKTTSLAVVSIIWHPMSATHLLELEKPFTDNKWRRYYVFLLFW